MKPHSAATIATHDRNLLLPEPDSTLPRRSKPAAAKVAPAAPGVDSDDSSLLLQHLLLMAQQYRSDGEVQSAMEVYWELVEDHSLTRQSGAARKLLLDLAATYERRKAPRMARSIYERLLIDEEN